MLACVYAQAGTRKQVEVDVMDDLTKLSLDSFLDHVADRTPTPGGGSVTGMAGALACALARMVGVYSTGKKTAPALRTRVEATAVQLHRADQLLRALITQDAIAYMNMTAAAGRSSASGKAGDASSAQTTYNDAVLAAVAVPMEIAAIASNALATMDEFKDAASRYLLSDLAVSAILADAAARAARYTVHVNARELRDATMRERLHSDIDDILKHCARFRESIEAYVYEHLEKE